MAQLIRDLLTRTLPAITAEQKKTLEQKAATRALQQALTKLGEYNGLIDGDFGRLTDGAVRQFQLKAAIEQDGDVGPVTAALIDLAIAALPPNVPPPEVPATVVPYQKEYTVLWNTMVIKPSKLAAFDKAIEKLRSPVRWQAYEALQAATGVPPQVTAVIHERECGADMRGYLGNGELIIGTGRKSKLVPANRGPFETFLQGGIDAYRKEGMVGLNWKTAGPARTAYFLEKFNGFGYRRMGKHSPYLWAQTNQQEIGKYTSDGHFDKNSWDTQLGGMPLLKRIMDTVPGLTW